MRERPKAGEFYRHFKDKLYQIVTVAIHSETGEELVIYQALYGEYKVYARPLEMFMSEVDHTKYPQVQQTYRFERVELSSENVQVQEVKETQVTELPSTDAQQERLLQFLDSDDWEEKYNLLISMRTDLTDHMINIMAASLDTVIEDGALEKRYDDLKYTIMTRQKYERKSRL